MVSRQIVFRATKFFDAVGEVGPGLERSPLDLPLFDRGVAHGLLPIDPGESHRRGLDRSLDEQAESIPALGGAGDFAALPEEIGLLGTDKALSGGFMACDRGELRFEVEPDEGALEPAMDAGITFLRAELAPVVIRREGEAVSPVGIMGNKPAAGGTANERTRQGEGGNDRVFLGVTERSRGLGPTVEPQTGRPSARANPSKASSKAML